MAQLRQFLCGSLTKRNISLDASLQLALKEAPSHQFRGEIQFMEVLRAVCITRKPAIDAAVSQDLKELYIIAGQKDEDKLPIALSQLCL